MINFSINLFNALLDKIILLRYKKKVQKLSIRERILREAYK